MTHEAKRLIEFWDARVERMQERQMEARSQEEHSTAAVMGAWADATQQAIADFRAVIRAIEDEAIRSASKEMVA